MTIMSEDSSSFISSFHTLRRGEGRRLWKNLLDDEVGQSNFSLLSKSLSNSLSELLSSNVFISEKTVAKLIVDIRFALEKYHGPKVSGNRMFPLPPTSLFLNFSPTSTLKTALQNFLLQVEARGHSLENLFSSPHHILLPFLKQFVFDLTKSWTPPCVWIGSLPSPLRAELSRRIFILGGTIALSEAQATHLIVLPSGGISPKHEQSISSAPPTSASWKLFTSYGINPPLEFGLGPRIVEILNANESRIHWLRVPDGYDEFFNTYSPSSGYTCIVDTAAQSAISGAMATSDSSNGSHLYDVLSGFQRRIRWYITPEFITDSYCWNEWSNECDYEVLVSEEKLEQLLNLGKKTKLEESLGDDAENLYTNEDLLVDNNNDGEIELAVDSTSGEGISTKSQLQRGHVPARKSRPTKRKISSGLTSLALHKNKKNKNSQHYEEVNERILPHQFFPDFMPISLRSYFPIEPDATEASAAYSTTTGSAFSKFTPAATSAFVSRSTTSSIHQQNNEPRHYQGVILEGVSTIIHAHANDKRDNMEENNLKVMELRNNRELPVLRRGIKEKVKRVKKRYGQEDNVDLNNDEEDDNNDDDFQDNQNFVSIKSVKKVLNKKNNPSNPYIIKLNNEENNGELIDLDNILFKNVYNIDQELESNVDIKTRKQIQVHSICDKLINASKDEIQNTSLPFQFDSSSSNNINNWLKFEAISEYERVCLYDLFIQTFNKPQSFNFVQFSEEEIQENNRKNALEFEHIYLMVRNSIINLYNLNPYINLTATNCRRKIGGDITLIHRIHQFLDAEGIINNKLNLNSTTFQAAQPPSLFPKSYNLSLKRLELNSILTEFKTPTIQILNEENQFSLLDETEEKVEWNYFYDDLLLASLAKFGMKWDAIAIELNKPHYNFLFEFNEKRSKELNDDNILTNIDDCHSSNKASSFTPKNCMIRFLELPLSIPLPVSTSNETQFKVKQETKKDPVLNIKNEKEIVEDLTISLPTSNTESSSPRIAQFTSGSPSTTLPIPVTNLLEPIPTTAFTSPIPIQSTSNIIPSTSNAPISSVSAPSSSASSIPSNQPPSTSSAKGNSFSSSNYLLSSIYNTINNSKNIGGSTPTTITTGIGSSSSVPLTTSSVSSSVSYTTIPPILTVEKIPATTSHIVIPPTTISSVSPPNLSLNTPSTTSTISSSSSNQQSSSNLTSASSYTPSLVETVPYLGLNSNNSENILNENISFNFSNNEDYISNKDEINLNNLVTTKWKFFNQIYKAKKTEDLIEKHLKYIKNIYPILLTNKDNNLKTYEDLVECEKLLNKLLSSLSNKDYDFQYEDLSEDEMDIETNEVQTSINEVNTLIDAREKLMESTLELNLSQYLNARKDLLNSKLEIFSSLESLQQLEKHHLRFVMNEVVIEKLSQGLSPLFIQPQLQPQFNQS